MDESTPVLLKDIYAARRRIAGRICRTPLVFSPELSRRFGANIYLKLDMLQPSGAFKLRGVMNKLATLSAESLARGVTTASTGNHGRAVAYAAAQLGVPATICVSSQVPANKVAAIEALGAAVRVAGRSQDEAFIEARRLVADEGQVLIPPFDDPAIVAGQGTLGLELMEDLPELDHAIIGLSGGGLLGGIGVALKGIHPGARLTGVSLSRGAAMWESLQAGRPVDVEEVASLGDSLGGGIGLDNRCTFGLVRQVMDDHVQVSEAAIARAMVYFLEQEKWLLEGAAVVGLAALEEHALAAPGSVIALVLSGNGVSMETWQQARALADVASS